MGQKNAVSDRRNIKLNEALQGMRTVKLYAWESLIEGKVAEVRKKEESFMKSIAWMNALLSFLVMALPQLAVCFTLVLYVQVHGTISGARAFYVANLFLCK